MLTSRARRFTPGTEPRYPLKRGLGGPQRFWRRDKSCVHTGIPTPYRPAHSLVTKPTKRIPIIIIIIVIIIIIMSVAAVQYGTCPPQNSLPFLYILGLHSPTLNAHPPEMFLHVSYSSVSWISLPPINPTPRPYLGVSWIRMLLYHGSRGRR